LTLYLDASALAKAYLAELGSSDVIQMLAATTVAATSAVAYAELRALFARATREGRITAHELTTTIALLDERWARYSIVAVDDARLREAGALAERHPRHALRALDTLHLASALRISAGEPAPITFACWDLRLWRAARDEGFTMLPAAEPV